MKSKKDFKEVVEKEMPEFVSEILALSTLELNGRLAQLSKDFQAVEEAKENDEELEVAKARKSELEAPYRDGKKAITLKSRYIISLIKDRGGDV